MAYNVQVINKQVILQEIALHRSVRKKRSAISNDYMVYSLEHKCDLSINKGSDSFKQAMKYNNFKK